MKYLLLLTLALFVSAQEIDFNELIKEGDWYGLLQNKVEYKKAIAAVKQNPYRQAAQVALQDARAQFKDASDYETFVRSFSGRILMMAGTISLLCVEPAIILSIEDMTGLKIAGISALALLSTAAIGAGVYLEAYPSPSVKRYMRALIVNKLLERLEREA